MSVRIPAKRHTRKTLLICPRCGKKQSVLMSDAKFMIVCPRCGAGMREQQVRARFTQ